jgi:hypothetical protein
LGYVPRHITQKSTGTRPAKGKAASSQNALESGIDAQSQIIRGEDPAALDALTVQCLLDHQPQSASERALVDILFDSEWTLRRLRKTEAQLWEYDLAAISLENTKSYNRDSPTPEDQVLGLAFDRRQETLARLDRRRESLQRADHRTLQDLRRGALWAQDSRAQVRLPHDRPADPPEAPNPPAAPSAPPPPTPLSQKPKPEIGFVPENPSSCGSPARETPQAAPDPGQNAA